MDRGELVQRWESPTFHALLTLAKLTSLGLVRRNNSANDLSTPPALYLYTYYHIYIYIYIQFNRYSRQPNLAEIHFVPVGTDAPPDYCWNKPPTGAGLCPVTASAPLCSRAAAHLRLHLSVYTPSIPLTQHGPANKGKAEQGTPLARLFAPLVGWSWSGRWELERVVGLKLGIKVGWSGVGLSWGWGGVEVET